MSVAEAVVLLEPSAERLAALVDTIEADVRQMDTEHLEALLVACSVVERHTEAHWAVLAVAPLVAKTAQVERGRREGHARLREAIKL